VDNREDSGVFSCTCSQKVDDGTRYGDNMSAKLKTPPMSH
jgi:hypothetical protein